MNKYSEKFNYVFDASQIHNIQGGTRELIYFLEEKGLISIQNRDMLIGLRNESSEHDNKLRLFVELTYKILKDNNL